MLSGWALNVITREAEGPHRAGERPCGHGAEAGWGEQLWAEDSGGRQQMEKPQRAVPGASGGSWALLPAWSQPREAGLGLPASTTVRE